MQEIEQGIIEEQGAIEGTTGESPHVILDYKSGAIYIVVILQDFIQLVH